jgi:N-acetylmuramoyl-L-alanine amidase
MMTMTPGMESAGTRRNDRLGLVRPAPPGARPLAFVWLGAAALVVVVVAGCVEPRPVIEQLPEPPVSTRLREPKPSPPPPPPPKPAPPPPKAVQRTIRGTTIVVDAGHGGKDPGAKGLSRLPEKAINLSIAIQLAQSLRARGANVTMTRAGDQFIELDDRAAAADRTRAALLVSIHSDANHDSTLSGATVYVARGASSSSTRAAEHIAAALRSAGIPVRGIRDAGYRVLVGHSRPAVLIECGYLTNRAEAQRLNGAGYRERLADAIADGIASHFGR